MPPPSSEYRPTYVFFFVGKDIGQPCVLVNSIRLAQPDAKIIQCSDSATPEIVGCDHVHRTLNCSDKRQLMLERIEAFKSLGLLTPAVYIDTDIIWLRPLNILDRLSDYWAVVCQRSFYAETIFKSTQSHGVSFPEHESKTIGETFPILACFTISASYHFWEELSEVLYALPDRYRTWYGDQEALKILLSTKGEAIGFAKEEEVACLPEFFRPNEKIPYAVHFKGPSRKAQMFEAAELMGIKS